MLTIELFLRTIGFESENTCYKSYLATVVEYGLASSIFRDLLTKSGIVLGDLVVGVFERLKYRDSGFLRSFRHTPGLRAHHPVEILHWIPLNG